MYTSPAFQSQKSLDRVCACAFVSFLVLGLFDLSPPTTLNMLTSKYLLLVLAILCALATVQGHRGGNDGGNDGGDGWGQGIGGGRFRFRPTPWALNPHGIFNKRLVSVGFFPWMDLFSFRSQSLNRSHDEIDVDLVGGFVSFNHAPIAVLAFWKYMAEWSHENFTAEGCTYPAC